MRHSEGDYYRTRSAAEREMADNAAHPEAQRRHVELAERYLELAIRLKKDAGQNKCYGLQV